MFDLSVAAVGGVWVLDDDREGRLGSFRTQAEALAAIGEFARADHEPRLVLIQNDGEWGETVVEPTPYH